LTSRNSVLTTVTGSQGPTYQVYRACESGARDSTDINIEIGDILLSKRKSGHEPISGQPYVFSSLNKLSVPRSLMLKFSGTDEERAIKVLKSLYRFVGVSDSKGYGIWTDHGLTDPTGVVALLGGLISTVTNNGPTPFLAGDIIVVDFPRPEKDSHVPIPNTPYDKRVPVIRPKRTIQYFPTKPVFAAKCHEVRTAPFDPGTENVSDALQMFSLNSMLWAFMLLGLQKDIDAGGVPAGVNPKSVLEAKAAEFKKLITTPIHADIQKALGRDDLVGLTMRQAALLLAGGVDHRDKVPTGSVELDQGQLAGFTPVDRAVRAQIEEVDQWTLGKSLNGMKVGQRGKILVGAHNQTS